MMPNADVAIAGASFAGLALALALAKSSAGELSITVLDRGTPAERAAVDDPRAVAVSQSSARMLDLLGVWPAVAGQAQLVSRIEISDSPLEAGVRPILLAWDNLLDGDAASYILPSSILTRALLDAIGTQPGIALLAGVEVAGLSVGDFYVEMLDPAGTTIVAANLAVAADGRHSALRTAAGIKTVGWDYPQIAIVTRIRHERPHAGVAVQHFLPAGPFAVLPLPDDRSCVTWTEDAVAARRILALDDQDFMAELEIRLGGRLGPLHLDGDRIGYPLEMHLARRYVAPRLALTGDAAHGVHPLAGQGLNLALRDAAALAECIVESMRAGLTAGDATALERYERWRRFDSWLSAATFDQLNRLFRGDATLLRSAREAGLQVVDRLPWLKQQLKREAAGVAGDLPRLLRGEPI